MHLQIYVNFDCIWELKAGELKMGNYFPSNNLQFPETLKAKCKLIIESMSEN